jgi:hypothetical protein
VLTIQERWRFESIPNQLVIYSSHKLHSPIKWVADHQRHHSGKRHGITIMDRNTQGPPECQESGPSLPLGSLFVPRHTPFSTSLSVWVYPSPNSVTSITVERYVIRPAKYETCVQHDKRGEQRSVLNRHRRKTTSTPEPCLVTTNYSVRSLVIHQYLVIPMISFFP